MPITLSSQARRRAASAGAAAVLSITMGLGVTACGANFEAQTLQPYQAAEGTNANSGGIAVRNMLVLAGEDGKGELHSAFVNTGKTDDTLVSIAAAGTVPGSQDGEGAQVPVTVSVGNVRPFSLRAGGNLTLPPPSGQPFTVTGGKPGAMVKLTITFSKAAPLTVDVPVLTTDHYSPTPRPEPEGGGHG